MSTERDTHFLGFAKQELEDLKPDLTLLFVALGSPLSSREEEIASAERILIEHLAQRAYDLVEHALSCNNGAEAHYWPDQPMSASVHYKRQLARATKDVPDLTALPPAAPESTAE